MKQCKCSARLGRPHSGCTACGELCGGRVRTARPSSPPASSGGAGSAAAAADAGAYLPRPGPRPSLRPLSGPVPHDSFHSGKGPCARCGMPGLGMRTASTGHTQPVGRAQSQHSNWVGHLSGLSGPCRDPCPGSRPGSRHACPCPCPHARPCTPPAVGWAAALELTEPMALPSPARAACARRHPPDSTPQCLLGPWQDAV